MECNAGGELKRIDSWNNKTMEGTTAGQSCYRNNRCNSYRHLRNRNDPSRTRITETAM